MNTYLKNRQKADCCGCSACSEKCPTSCIHMKQNKEGFEYPEIDVEKCINCNLCMTVCPMENEKSTVANPPEVCAYAAYSADTETVMKSSSGGIFSVLAEEILRQNGYVFGAALNDQHILRHTMVHDLESLETLRGSKYIQSNMKGIYPQCRILLEKGKTVLFTGTPCQISGLKCYLGKNYPNLFTADVICHGVPSQKMFDAYVDFLEKKHRAKLVDINFRDKSKNGWSITLRYTMEKENGKKRRYDLLSPLSEYFSGFLGGYISRESCYHCPYSSLSRPGDITMGDFWGYQKTRPELVHKEGLSLIFINSIQGQKLLNILEQNGTVLSPIDENSIINSENKNLYKPTTRPTVRDVIYTELDSNGFAAISSKYLRKGKTIKNRIKNMIPNDVIHKLKNCKF